MTAVPDDVDPVLSSETTGCGDATRTSAGRPSALHDLVLDAVGR